MNGCDYEIKTQGNTTILTWKTLPPKDAIHALAIKRADELNELGKS